MMKIPIVLCGILCASSVHSFYHTVQESMELREFSNALLNMTTAHITTIYGQYISWVERIARERREGISGRRHKDANRHYMSHTTNLLSSWLTYHSEKNIFHPKYIKCSMEEYRALYSMKSHETELENCFEAKYTKILSHEELMKSTQRMILDRLKELNSELNGCAIGSGKSTDNFYNCVNSPTYEIALLYLFSIRDNMKLKMDGQTMSMPPRARLDVSSCYNKIYKMYDAEVRPTYERLRRCYTD